MRGVTVLPLLLQIHLAVAVAVMAVAVAVMAGSFSSNDDDHTFAAVAQVAPCLHDQEAALLRLKRSFAATADSITAFRSWKVGEDDCCGWAGVHCGDADGRVTSLDLGNWGLESAGIDHALFNLTSLRHLNLGWNNFKMSELPSTGFERLAKLTTLNLSNANFSGQIPHSIGRLTNLVSLDLSISIELKEIPGVGYKFGPQLHNMGDIAIPEFTSLVANLGSLRELHLDLVDLSQSADWCDALSMYTPNLRVLSLPFCGVSGPICGTLSALHSLTVIDLHLNSLTGPIPHFFANYSFLSVLQLSYNTLEGWVSHEIFQHKKLVTIDLHHNLKISGSLPNISADSCLQNLLVGGTNFSGTIPSSIGKLKSLKRLDLGAPGFSGNLPSSIGEMKSLNTLKISGLNLVGPVPSWITNLTSLEVLQFSQCGLYGPIPSSISHLIKLKTLVIMQCKALGRILSPHIFNITELEELVLASNNFTGTVELNSFWRLPNLSFLDLSNNKIVVLEGQDNFSMVSFPNIVYLKLASCSITKFPTILKHLNDSDGIDLSNNQMHGAIPRWLWEKWATNPNCHDLFFLNFSHNQLTSVGYDTFLPVCPEMLDFSFNKFEGPIPLPQYSAVLDYSSNMFSSMPRNFSTQLENTAFFKASRNNLSGNIPTSFCMNLKVLDVSYNTFSGSVPSCLLEDANTLKVLNLKGNQLNGDIPHNINKSCSLELLDISDNRIEGMIPRSLVTCKSLEVLSIANNEITDPFPCWLSILQRLQVLILKQNKFFGPVTPSSAKENTMTCGFPSLRILDLSSNFFSGTLNKEWISKLMAMMVVDVSNDTKVMEYDSILSIQYLATTELTYKRSELRFDKILGNLVFLDVSNNAFQGSLPTSIGELVFLRGLNMSHNSFTGQIPSQLGHLTLLESLDLCSNELSGEIPSELAKLDSLTTLDLSNNKLVGSIPESPHFSTFSNSSFLGNVGLCGPPLSKKCVNTTTTNVASHQSKKKSVDIILFLFAGVGFGVGFATAIVWGCGIPIRKQR